MRKWSPRDQHNGLSYDKLGFLFLEHDLDCIFRVIHVFDRASTLDRYYHSIVLITSWLLLKRIICPLYVAFQSTLSIDNIGLSLDYRICLSSQILKKKKKRLVNLDGAGADGDDTKESTFWHQGRPYSRLYSRRRFSAPTVSVSSSSNRTSVCVAPLFFISIERESWFR